MAPLPPLTPSPPEAPGARVPGRTRSVLSGESVRQSDADVILDKLRQIIAAGTQETETILGSIAEATRSLTGATGTAIAMPRDGAVRCVGRSGETAPELGARLNVDSGISGECLRTGAILRCDDASRDFHVDAEVCRRLGLQSIAVVPLRGQHGRVGVLEAFSTQSYAFSHHDMDILGRLAGLAEAAWVRRSGTEVSSKAETTDEEESHFTVGQAASPLAIASDALARVGEALRTGLYDKLQTERKWRYGTIGGLSVLVLILLSVLGWRVWYKASIASKSVQHPSPQAAPAERPDVAAIRRLLPPHGIGYLKVRGGLHGVRRRGRVGPRNRTLGSGFPRQSNSGSSVNMDTSGSIPGADDISQIAASSASSTDLGSALSTASTMPRLSLPISQAMAGGILQHKVQPVYPPDARRVRLEGNVVLEAMVTVEGQVEDLKLISGNSLLAQAAMDAVSQWRYTPYLLNGKPARKEIRITISFVAPQ
jgi:TonB family protein